MQILNNLFNPQIDKFSRAMSTASQRQSLLTANLANVNTPGYKRKDMSLDITIDDEFEKHVNAARWRRDGGRVIESTGSLRPDGNNVDLEKETMAIAETELRYQTVTELTARYFSGIKSVIREGR